MVTITLTLKLPFLDLNQNKVIEFERLQSLNTEIANGMLAMAKQERRKLTSKNFADIEIASAFINQTIRNANAETKVKKFKTLPLETNNQNWKLQKVGSTYSVVFNLCRDRSKRIPVAIHTTKNQAQLDAILAGEAKAGTLKIWRSQKGIWYALISVSMEVPDAPKSERFVGVDRGQRHLAVAATPEGIALFLSFQYIRHIRRHFATQRRRLQKAGKTRVVKRIEQTEQRIIRHINHIISKQIIAFALKHNCGIRIEDLSGIRNSKQNKKAKSDAGYNRDYWPYYDLEQKIIYKAALAGVVVEKIPSAYTSKACSKCHAIGERKGNHFSCSRCSYQGHADHNAAVNIGNWLGMACLVLLKFPETVIASGVEPGAVYGTPPSLVNTSKVTESLAS